MTTSMSEKLMSEEVDEIAQQTCSRSRPNRNPDQVEEGVQDDTSINHVSLISLLVANVRRAGALRPMPYCLGIGSTRVGPGFHPQYTRAWYAGEAVGGPSNSTSRNTAQTSVEHRADEHVTQVRRTRAPMMCKSPMTRKRECNSQMERSDRTWKRTRNMVAEAVFVQRRMKQSSSSSTR